MHKWIIRFFTVLSLCLVSSCNQKDELSGVWLSEPRESEWGRVVIQYEFSGDGELEVLTSFLDSSKPEGNTSLEGSYSILGENNFSSPQLNKGKPIKYELSGGELTIFPGAETVSLKRK